MKKGSWTALNEDDAVSHNDVVASYSTVMLWSGKEREVFGVFEIAPGAPPPEGMLIASTTLEDRDGRPAWVNTFEPIPYAPSDEPAFVPVAMLRQRIEKLGMWDDFAAYLAQNPAEMLKVLTLEGGVDPTYPAITAAFEAMKVPEAARAYILAQPSAGVPDPQPIAG
ncbi:hypothetical protein [Aureimonas psammosilenae]|uniref:hypothetical protein n=1 Tax=Aureimonas psammosilenae TaxID=2495496 RepID=UPI001260679F|nr:hypothetical protein [Aureimonas psammosilenae]